MELYGHLASNPPIQSESKKYRPGKGPYPSIFHDCEPLILGLFD